MTYPQFLDALRQTPRDWFLVRTLGGIRRRAEWLSRAQVSCCPITALRGEPASSFRRVADDLGLPEDLAGCIADSADNTLRGQFDPQVRADLLDACGLTEPEGAR